MLVADSKRYPLIGLLVDLAETYHELIQKLLQRERMLQPRLEQNAHEGGYYKVRRSQLARVSERQGVACLDDCEYFRQGDLLLQRGFSLGHAS